MDNAQRDERLAVATSIIEQYCGRSIGTQTRTERVELNSNNRRLTDVPVRVIAVRGLMRGWDLAKHFGEQWVDINVEDVHIDNRGEIYMPATLFNTTYDAADVTYEYGWTELPADIQRACELLADQLDGINVSATPAYRLLSLITPEVADLLSNYREGRSLIV